MRLSRPLLLLAALPLALTSCAQLNEQASGSNATAHGAHDGGGFDHCTPDRSTCYRTAEDLARWGGHDHDETQPKPVPAPQPESLPESSTDLVI